MSAMTMKETALESKASKYKPRRPARPIPEDLFRRAKDIFERTDWWTNSRGCKLWPKVVNWSGYGQIALKDENRVSRTIMVHRFAWELAFGKIPDGLWVLHKCDERRCCNPEHLFLGTEEDNWKDMYAKRRNPREDRHPHAKIDRELAKKICELASAGKTCIEIAKQYGLSENTVRRVKNGHHWTTRNAS